MSQIKALNKREKDKQRKTICQAFAKEEQNELKELISILIILPKEDRALLLSKANSKHAWKLKKLIKTELDREARKVNGLFFYIGIAITWIAALIGIIGMDYLIQEDIIYPIYALSISIAVTLFVLNGLR